VNSAFSDLSASWIPELLARAQRGEERAFGQLCQAFEPRLLRQAILLCGNDSLAEDLAQETLIEAWKCLDRFNGRCQFFTWLCAILHHRHRSALRRKWLLSFLGLENPREWETQEMAQQPIDDEPWPDRAAESREQAALVRRCVQCLPPKQQQVVFLRFFVDDSLEGIAVALRCSVGTVKSRLFHALEKLRTMRDLQEHRECFGKKFHVV
jgi:RNA polymerase sigma-70 factor (ECF subfamily)